MKRNDWYMVEVYKLFMGIDLKCLDESLNGEDHGYADAVVKRLQAAHQKIYGKPGMPGVGEETMMYPALIRREDDGRIMISLAECSLISMPNDPELFDLLGYRLLQLERIQIPKEYEALGLYSGEKASAEQQLDVIVITWEKSTMQCMDSFMADKRAEMEAEKDCGCEDEEEVSIKTMQ